MKTLWIVLVLGLGLGWVAAQDEQTRTVNYICEGNRPMKVVFAPTEALVTFKGDQFMLPEVVSGSGFRYSNELVTLEGIGEQATLNSETAKRLMAKGCRVSQ